MLMVFSFRIQQEMKEPWLQSGRLGTLHVKPVARVGGLIAGIDYAMCPTSLRKSRAGRKPNIAACTTVQKCVDACSVHITHGSHRHFRTWKRSLQIRYPRVVQNDILCHVTRSCIHDDSSPALKVDCHRTLRSKDLKGKGPFTTGVHPGNLNRSRAAIDQVRSDQCPVVHIDAGHSIWGSRTGTLTNDSSGHAAHCFEFADDHAHSVDHVETQVDEGATARFLATQAPCHCSLGVEITGMQQDSPPCHDIADDACSNDRARSCHSRKEAVHEGSLVEDPRIVCLPGQFKRDLATQVDRFLTVDRDMCRDSRLNKRAMCGVWGADVQHVDPSARRRYGFIREGSSKLEPFSLIRV